MQVALPTPLLFVLFVLVTKRGWKPGGEAKWNFAVAFSLPVIALFAFASIKGAFRMNWTAPAFLALLPAAAALLLEVSEKHRLWRRLTGATAIVCALLIVLGHFEMATLRLRLMKHGGWRSLAEQVTAQEKVAAEATGKTPFVLGADKYNLAAEMGFYLGDPDRCVNSFALGEQGLGYRYWTDLEQFRGRPAVIVMSRSVGRDLDKLRPYFERLDPPQLAPGQRPRKVYLATGYGYRPDPRGREQ
jgi:dolichol-phosphate mannosyltransferase